MKKSILLLFIILSFVFSKEFTIASYNVENLFDLKVQKSEYKEYIPNTKSKWNQKIFNIKINNIIKVIKDINADIIGLQEIENRELMKTLLKRLPQYKYYSFIKYNNSAVGVGFLSKIKILNNRQIDVKFSNKLFRPILETTFEIDNIEFKVFNNHWPSKRVSENYRIKYAKKLQDRLSTLQKDYDYILLGDFNSNYNEIRTFAKDKKLNNTNGITGINQILNTTINKKYITYDDVLKSSKKVHFNLWLELNSSERFSNKYRRQNNTPDNMIVSPALLDTKKISYIYKSFKVFKPSYLYKNEKIIRWEISRNKYNPVHKGSGFSDHLPIYAKFSTSKNDRNLVKKVKNTQKKELSKISELYNKIKLVKPILLKDVIVIYKSDNSAIIKQKNDRAIYIYKHAKNLELGYSYDLQINEIIDYNGLKEIESFSIIEKNKKENLYKTLFLNSSNTNIFDHKNQNEILTNLKGKVKNKKLYFNGKHIKLFAKNKKDLPKNGSTILFKKAHLSNYRGNIQILIHDKSDYEETF